MKTKIVKLIMLLLILPGSFSSCKEKEPNDKHDLISSNLLKMGSVESALLIGEWDIIKFAYTADGKKISNQAVIPIDPFYDIEWIASHNGISIEEAIDILRPKFKIPDPPITPPEDEWHYWDDVNEHWVINPNVLWHLYACNSSTWTCSLSGNLINIKACGSTSKLCTTSSENDIWFALTNAYSFVIRGNELIIYFTGIEKLDKIQKKEFQILENYNLLILKKR